jgi:Uma2 family endonuclease
MSIRQAVQPPPLEPGDHLTRAEFERRYEAMPNGRKAELIEGVVIMPSPVRLAHHGTPTVALICWLTHYWALTPGVRVAQTTTVRLDLDNEPQPDVLMIIEPSCGGRVRISPDDYIEGAPELVGEVTSSTVSYDLNTKLNVYRRNQVREYVAWRVLEQAIDWFVLEEEKYIRLPADGQGVLQSRAFPGLWLEPAALLRSDLARVLQVLQQGLATPEHEAFVARLQAAQGSAK